MYVHANSYFDLLSISELILQPVLMYMYAFSIIEYQKESEKQNNHVLRTGARSRALSQKWYGLAVSLSISTAAQQVAFHSFGSLYLS